MPGARGVSSSSGARYTVPSLPRTACPGGRSAVVSLPACPRELVLLLRLHLATLGREGLAAEILCRLGHLRSIFESDAESLARLPRVGPRAARRILSAEIAAVARREVERAS